MATKRKAETELNNERDGHGQGGPENNSSGGGNRNALEVFMPLEADHEPDRTIAMQKFLTLADTTRSLQRMFEEKDTAHATDSRRADTAESQNTDFKLENTRLQHELDNIMRQHRATEANNLRLQTELDDKIKQLGVAETALHSATDAKYLSPFAAILIDGDGYVFKDALLRQGFKGGKLAGQQLRASIMAYFHSLKLDGCSQWELLIFVYMNLEKLAIGLTLIGFGKERADGKIRARFNTLVNNLQCAHVIMGCTHDNGYVTMLGYYEHDAK